MGQAKTQLRVRSRIKVDSTDRSANMRAIRSKGTKPEIAVRQLVHRMGLRFRLHRADLPGKPDLVFPSRRKVIFVHGCFWHSHGCSRSHVPRSNLEYWRGKLERNSKRDALYRRSLKSAGWKLLVIWECEVKNVPVLSRRVARFLR